jgi:hypothetical protein
MPNLGREQAREGARDFEKERTGERDSGKEFSRAEHQARNDAVSTDYQVRDSKEEAQSSNKK